MRKEIIVHHFTVVGFALVSEAPKQFEYYSQWPKHCMTQSGVFTLGLYDAFLSDYLTDLKLDSTK